MKKSEINHISSAFRYSWAGLKSAFRSEVAFRQDLMLCFVFFVIAIVLPCDLKDKALLISPLFFIVFAELVNTAIETVVDRISEELHPLSKKAKDIGSALVLISFLNAICVWLFIITDLFIFNK